MTTYLYCSVEIREHLWIVTINRPEVMNAIHRPANLELETIFQAFDSDQQAWVAIITGAGDKAFSAGNDLKYQAAGNDTTMPASGFGGLTACFGMNKPVIAAVNGLAMGGGFEIALACDLLVASENAMFALPEPHVGLAATAGGLLRLPRQIPMKQAMGMILTGRRVDAAEGLQLGFVNEVVPIGQALDAAIRWADLVMRGSPMAVRAAKELVHQGMYATDGFESLYRRQKSLPAVKALYDSADKLEGPRAFSEKRSPVWSGH